MRAIVVQADGKIIFGGEFDTVGGTARSRIARLNVDGSVDSTFDADTDGPVLCLAVQADGKCLVGGLFSTLGGQPRTNIARVNADGTVDPSFNPGADDVVNCLALQPNGKILVGGQFTMLGGQARRSIGRVSANGALDVSFDPGADGNVASLVVQADGKILVGGHFTMLGGTNRNCMGRLDRDGRVEPAFDPGVTGGDFPLVSGLAVQRDGRILVGGTFTMLGGGSRTNLGRLNPDGSLDGSLKADANAAVYCVQPQADGKILVGGAFTILGGKLRSRIARLTPDAILDTSFNPGASIPATNNTTVFNLAVQPDAKILVGGLFTRLHGQSRTNFGRLNLNGSLDSTLSAAVTSGVNDPAVSVFSLAVQPNASILVGGFFSSLGAVTLTNIARLLADGNVDGFSPRFAGTVLSLVLQDDGKIKVAGESGPQVGGLVRRLNLDGSVDSGFQQSSADSRVVAQVLQPSGKLFVGGTFSYIAGHFLSGLARLNPNGSLDTTFDPGASGGIYTLAMQPDGMILVGGNFSGLLGQPRNHIGRLNPEGSLDNNSNPSANGTVYCFATQPDGKILVAGDFTMLGTNGSMHTRIGRLYPDGSIDETFNPAADSIVRTMALQADGKIIVGGYFATLNGQPHTRIGRLNVDGTLDTNFNAQADGIVFGVAIQADGNILIGGSMATVNGLPRTRLARLTSGSAALQQLTIDPTGTAVTWTRSGAGPEVEPVSFEYSTDGTNYTLLGAAMRIGSGWQLSGLPLPAGQNFYVRARGRTRGGDCNNSSGMIESVAQFYRSPPPYLAAPTLLGSGAFQFTFTNFSASSFRVFATTNFALPLSSWTPLGSPTATGGGNYQFQDLDATNSSKRFYYLRSP